MNRGRDRRKAVETERDSEVKRFVERFSLSLADVGVPRMAARVFAALLVVDDGRRTAAEIAEYLKISRAAVSGAVRFLVQMRLVAREREPGHAVDHYRVLDDAWAENALWKDGVIEHWEAVLASGAEVLTRGSPAWHRIEETRQFYAFAREELHGLIERWRVRRKELRARSKASGGSSAAGGKKGR